MSTKSPSAIKKVLSSNDVGETGGHQAGILVPKDPDILSFFPKLDGTRKNPDAFITVRDASGEEHWNLRFVYYNGKALGDGTTRNEYRLTGMTGMFRFLDARVGDSMVFRRTALGDIVVGIERGKAEVSTETTTSAGTSPGGWQIVSVEDE